MLGEINPLTCSSLEGRHCLLYLYEWVYFGMYVEDLDLLIVIPEYLSSDLVTSLNYFS